MGSTPTLRSILGIKKYKRNNCLHCGNSCKNVPDRFCSNYCYGRYQFEKNVSDWKLGLIPGVDKNQQISVTVRRYLFEKYDSKCIKCGWCEVNLTTGKVPLQVNHIDGNYLNSVESNLELLCPNCHSLTSTFGSLNKGQGRRNRKCISDVNSKTTPEKK